MYNALKKLWAHIWLAVFVIFGITATFTIWSGIPDSDTFFLAATGRYIVETGTVPTINPFVIHENFGIIVQQWLFDVIVYGAFETFGNAGLFFLVFALFTYSMGLLYGYLGLFTENKKIKNSIFLLSGVIFLFFANARPTIVSFPVMLSLLYCVEQYRRTNKKRFLVALPLLSLVEINMHAAMWPMMFVLLMPYIFPFFLLQAGSIKDHCKTWFYANKYILLAMVFMFAAGFLNPNGIQGMGYVLNSYGNATGGVKIAELQAPSTADWFGFFVLIAFAFFAVYLYQNKDKFLDSSCDLQEQFTRISMAAGVLFLGAMHIRNAWYIILGAMPVAILALEGFKLHLPDKEKVYSTAELLVRSTVCIFVSAIIGFFMFFYSSGEEISTNKDSVLSPVAAADYLDLIARQKAVLYTEFNNGAYMEWRGYKVYMDARPELFQTEINGQEDVYTEYMNVQNGSIDYAEFLDKYDFTYLIVSDGALLGMYLSLDPGFEVVVDGNGYRMFERIPVEPTGSNLEE